MLQGPFRVPSFNGYIPCRLQPWIYLLFAFIFLMSGGIYGGAMSQVMGEYSLMREDVLMIIMFNVVGVAMPFPFLFKMKFHFTNRQLLLNAALVVATCNFLIMWTDSVPLMCILAYIAGFFKLCGTFECMSTIQLWMTSKRDFTIFFPLLYCIVLGNMFLSPWVTEHLIYIYQDWRIINWAMTGALLLVALIVYVTTHDFRFMNPLPFISLDYLGCILWSAWMRSSSSSSPMASTTTGSIRRLCRWMFCSLSLPDISASSECSTSVTLTLLRRHGSISDSSRCSSFLPS